MVLTRKEIWFMTLQFRFFVTILIDTNVIHGLESCTLNIASLPKNEPLLVINRQLALPDSEGKLMMVPGERFNMSCAGSKHRSSEFENIDGAKEVTASCVGGQAVQVKGQAVMVEDLGCKTQVKGDVLVFREKCGNIGTKMELGFRIRGVWYGVIQVCHHNDTSATLYTSHRLYGASLPAVSRKNQVDGRPKFHRANIYKFKPNSVYKKSSQARVLSTLLGGDKFAEKFLTGTYLARGHLAPNSDFILDTYQDLTFFYVNAAPQWQVINNGNWASVERRVRQFAESQGKTFQIITGTYGVLSLQDSQGELQEIWLYRKGGEKRLPVAHYFWKVVYDPEIQAGIAFVSLNQMQSEADRLCEDVCDVTGWSPHSGSWRNSARGYVYCCDVTELSRTVTYLPQLDVQRMLTLHDMEESDEKDLDEETEEDDSDDEDTTDFEEEEI